MNSIAAVAEVSEIADLAINMALEKLDEREISMIEQTFIDSSKNCNSDHKKLFARRAF